MKKYNTPQMAILFFNVSDICTASISETGIDFSDLRKNTSEGTSFIEG